MSRNTPRPANILPFTRRMAANSAVTIQGYASLFGVADMAGDVMAPGAFAASLRSGRPVRFLYQHRSDEPLGRITRLSEDARGLAITAELSPASQRAREVAGLIRDGALDGLSIGFRSVRALSRSGGGRIIREAELWEVSVVTFPMLSAARITAITPDPAQHLSLELAQ